MPVEHLFQVKHRMPRFILRFVHVQQEKVHSSDK